MEMTLNLVAHVDFFGKIRSGEGTKPIHPQIRGCTRLREEPLSKSQCEQQKCRLRTHDVRNYGAKIGNATGGACSIGWLWNMNDIGHRTSDALRHQSSLATTMAMELVKVMAGTVEGVDGYLVEVEVSRSEPKVGIGRTTVVGLPDQAVRESIDRVTPALFAGGLAHRPGDHLVVNLAPADRRKEGPAFDLAIAIGFASTMSENKLPPPPADTVFLAELALDGSLRPLSWSISLRNCGA
jgi:Subunit ChlI of Mg-chelatase